MRGRWFRLALYVAAATLPAWAAAGEQPATKAEAAQHVASKHAEVERLQQDVASQEAQTDQADRKMEEQDRAIADLRRQIEALKTAKAAPGQGH